VSPAVCGRGLKLKKGAKDGLRHWVARRVRAWIETRQRRLPFDSGIASPAVCGRGLKQRRRIDDSDVEVSPAVCGRGLKRICGVEGRNNPDVARRVRAWIETSRWTRQIFGGAASPAVCGRGLKQKI